MIYIIIGSIILFSLGFFLAWTFKPIIQDQLWYMQDVLEEKKARLKEHQLTSDKYYMEQQLRIKLETEALLKQIDDDVRKSLDEVGRSVDINI